MTNCRNLLLSSVIAICLGGVVGCDDAPPRRPNRNSGGTVLQTAPDTSVVLVESISRTLNHLASEVVTELQPPQPVLDASRSADGQEVLATLDVTPGVPDSPFNYLFVPEGNGNFRTAQVRPGDIVRYYIRYNQDDLEHGYENVSYIELVVRRLDANNPQNALIVEGGLSGPVDMPYKIEIWRISDKRMNEIHSRLKRYVEKPRTTIGWEPSPDESGLVQLGDRLNQWWRNLPAPEQSWQSEPLAGELPAALREDPLVGALIAPAALENGGFPAWEVRLLQEAIWLRDIAAWAKKDGLTDVEIATQLFDWTVRNIQLEEPGDVPFINHPWQTLLYGRGSAEQRAWVFAELCRQQQLDVVMLSSPRGEGQPGWWLPALVSESQLYLFDPELGLPLPGKMPGTVATLAEFVAEPELLDQITVAGAAPYAVTADQFRQEGGPQLTAWIVASPLQLSRRAAALQRVLEGEDYVVLAADTRRAADALKTVPQVTDVRLWEYQFASLVAENALPQQARQLAALNFLVFAQRPLLYKARVLHFQGNKELPPAERNDPLAQPDLGHRQATSLYQDPLVRPSDKTLRELAPDKQVLYGISKADASYWLGLLSYDTGKYEIATEWLQNRTLDALPNGPWTSGARYNLARTREAMGDLPAAIALLEADDSPQRAGNLLRAKRLRESAPAEQE